MERNVEQKRIPRWARITARLAMASGLVIAASCSDDASNNNASECDGADYRQSKNELVSTVESTAGVPDINTVWGVRVVFEGDEWTMTTAAGGTDRFYWFNHGSGPADANRFIMNYEGDIRTNDAGYETVYGGVGFHDQDDRPVCSPDELDRLRQLTSQVLQAA